LKLFVGDGPEIAALGQVLSQQAEQVAKVVERLLYARLRQLDREARRGRRS